MTCNHLASELTVRQKVKDLSRLVQDAAVLRGERKKAKLNKDKFTGISSYSGPVDHARGVGESERLFNVLSAISN